MNDQELTPEIASQFRTRKLRQFAMVPVILIGIIPILMLDESSNTVFGLPMIPVICVSAAIIIGSLIFSFLNWRCPSCKSYLGKAINPKFCQSCGTRLQ